MALLSLCSWLVWIQSGTLLSEGTLLQQNKEHLDSVKCLKVLIRAPPLPSLAASPYLWSHSKKKKGRQVARHIPARFSSHLLALLTPQSSPEATGGGWGFGYICVQWKMFGTHLADAGGSGLTFFPYHPKSYSNTAPIKTFPFQHKKERTWFKSFRCPIFTPHKPFNIFRSIHNNEMCTF